jgi:hypothetical protein
MESAACHPRDKLDVSRRCARAVSLARVFDNRSPRRPRIPAGRPMQNTQKAELVCRIVSKAVHDLAIRHASGAISEVDFVSSLLELEKDHITPHGLTLVASNTIDDWTHFALHVVETKRICAGFEFNPHTGVFRRSQLGCDPLPA